MHSYSDTLRRGDHIGCYQIEEVIGRGGFAVTYLAHDLHLDVKVAIKEYLPREIARREPNLNVSPSKDEFVEDYDLGLKNFAREAKTLARFKHPNIVRVHQVLHKYHTAYMVMDYERGVELAELLDERQTLPESELLTILLPVLSGLEEIHAQGYLHRDIKPSNIYLRDNGPPLLLDFGAARFAMSETTQQLTAVVTVGYTPIEQYNVSEIDQGPWSDVYALAAVLYEAVTGKMPVDSITRATALQIKQDRDPLPSVYDCASPEYSTALLNAIDWGLRFDAVDRPQSVTQWREQLTDAPSTTTSSIGQTTLSQPIESGNVAIRLNEDVPNLDVIALTPHDSRAQTRNQSQGRTSSRTSDTVSQTSQNRHLSAPSGDVTELAQHRREPSGLFHTAASSPRHSSQPHDSATAVLADPVTLDATVNKPARTPTQEVRDKVRRDIMGRTSARGSTPPPVGRRHHASDLGSSPSAATARLNNIEPLTIEERPLTPPSLESGPRFVPMLDATNPNRDFEERHWDTPRPSRLAPLRWILPTFALCSVIVGALWFVNQPVAPIGINADNAPINIAESLAQAETLQQRGAMVFPVGASALDKYRSVLEVAPSNTKALAAIAAIEAQISTEIANNAESGNLSEANRLIVRANNAGLQVPNVTALPTSSTLNNSASTPAILASVAKIELLLANNQTAAAQALFSENAKFINDAALHNRLSSAIVDQAAAHAASTSTAAATVRSAPVDPIRAESLSGQSTNSNATIQSTQTTIAAVSTNTNVNTSTTLLPPSASTTHSEPATKPAPPKFGYTAASGALGRHLDALRQAVEAKSIARVVSTANISADREKFLQGMFSRYDRLSVSIVDVQHSGTIATAKVNVSMFNERRDGSFYSAGKWSGVTLKTNQQDGDWQRINW